MAADPLDPAPVDKSAITRLAPIAGIAFVVLFACSFIVMDTPEGDASDEEWILYWRDSGHRQEGIVASISMIVSAVALTWFVGGLRRRLHGRVGSDAAFGCGIAMAVLALFAGFAAGVVPLGHDLADVPVPEDADVVRLVDGGYYGVLFLAMPYAMAGFLLPLCWAMRGITELPRWLWISGAVVGVVCLSGPFLFFVPHLLFLIWTLFLCVLLLSREHRPTDQRWVP